MAADLKKKSMGLLKSPDDTEAKIIESHIFATYDNEHQKIGKNGKW